MAETEELPRTIVRRIVKGKLADLTKDMVEKREISVHKEAIIAFSESAKVFIHYLAATANEICKESKRQTISAEDVLKAIEEIGFLEFAEPLRASLEDFRKDNAIKKSEAKEKGQGKKSKSEAVQTEQENAVEAADNVVDSENAPVPKEEDFPASKDDIMKDTDDNGDGEEDTIKES